MSALSAAGRRVMAPALVGTCLGCSQPAPAPSVEEQRPEPFVEIELGRSHRAAEFCLLDSTSCLALDSRPFEPCLLTTERCPGDAHVFPAPAAIPRDQ